MGRFLSRIAFLVCILGVLFSIPVVANLFVIPSHGHPVIHAVLLALFSLMVPALPILGIVALLKPAGIVGSTTQSESGGRQADTDSSGLAWLWDWAWVRRPHYQGGLLAWFGRLVHWVFLITAVIGLLEGLFFLWSGPRSPVDPVAFFITAVLAGWALSAIGRGIRFVLARE